MRYSRIVSAVALLLALALTSAALASTVFAQTAEEKVYTVLGDSIAAGYRLGDYPTAEDEESGCAALIAVKRV